MMLMTATNDGLYREVPEACLPRVQDGKVPHSVLIMASRDVRDGVMMLLERGAVGRSTALGNRTAAFISDKYVSL